MSRNKAQKKQVRLSVSLDESEYAELSRLGEQLDLSAAWMIRRAVSEFVARHRNNLAQDFPLTPPDSQSGNRTEAAGG